MSLLKPAQGEKRTLKASAIRGGVVTTIGQACQMGIQLVSTLVMARLLTPADFGKVAMVSSMLGFILLFRDMGLSTATIQNQTITHEQTSALFWLNILFGLIVAIAIAAASPLVNLFYHDASLIPIVLAYAAIAPLSCLGAQHYALLQRDMRFTSLTIRNVVSSLLGLAAGITAAWMGLGFWAIPINEAVFALVSVVLLWTSSGWRPSRPKRTPGLGPLLRFGGGLTAANFFAFLNHNLDSMLLGRYYGNVAVGLYTRAHMLFNKPLGNVLPPMMGVALPVFAQVKNDPPRFTAIALRASQIMCLLGCSIVMIVTPCADWAVTVLLGKQWLEAAPIAAVLGWFILFEPLATLVGVLLTASGKSREMAIWRGVTLGIVAVGFAIGLKWGPIGIAYAYTITGIGTRLWLIYYAGKNIGITAWQFVESCWAFLAAAAVVGGSIVLVRHVWTPPTALLGCVIVWPIAVLGYFGLLFSYRPTRRFLTELYDLRTSLPFLKAKATNPV